MAGKDALHLLCERWDSLWYQRVADGWYGYEVHLPNGSVHSDLAFFPMLPALERGLAELLPMRLATAGLAISWTASLAAAWGIYAVGARLHGRRTGVVLAVMWACYPTAYVQSMAYAETLFTATAAWTLYAVLTERWILAAPLTIVAGLTRPSAAALIAALTITVVVAVATERNEGLDWSAISHAHRRMLTGVALAPLGWLGYVVFVGVRQGDPLAYFAVQAEWGNSIDGGIALTEMVFEHLTSSAPLAGVGLVAVFTLLGWVMWRCVKQRQPLPVLIYTVAVVVISLIGSGYFTSRPRLMMPAFPLLLPAAVALVRWGNMRTWWTLSALAAASGAYGAFILLGSGPP